MPSPKLVSFQRYISTRKYHQGRGSNAGWAFIAYALGDPHLPEAASWHELRAYLVRNGAEQSMIEAANTVWRSYLSYVSKERRNGPNNGIEQMRLTAARRTMASAAGT